MRSVPRSRQSALPTDSENAPRPPPPPLSNPPRLFPSTEQLVNECSRHAVFDCEPYIGFQHETCSTSSTAKSDRVILAALGCTGDGCLYPETSTIALLRWISEHLHVVQPKCTFLLIQIHVVRWGTVHAVVGAYHWNHLHVILFFQQTTPWVFNAPPFRFEI